MVRIPDRNNPNAGFIHERENHAMKWQTEILVFVDNDDRVFCTEELRSLRSPSDFTEEVA